MRKRRLNKVCPFVCQDQKAKWETDRKEGYFVSFVFCCTEKIELSKVRVERERKGSLSPLISFALSSYSSLIRVRFSDSFWKEILFGQTLQCERRWTDGENEPSKSPTNTNTMGTLSSKCDLYPEKTRQRLSLLSTFFVSCSRQRESWTIEKERRNRWCPVPQSVVREWGRARGTEGG